MSREYYDELRSIRMDDVKPGDVLVHTDTLFFVISVCRSTFDRYPARRRTLGGDTMEIGLFVEGAFFMWETFSSRIYHALK